LCSPSSNDWRWLVRVVSVSVHRFVDVVINLIGNGVIDGNLFVRPQGMVAFLRNREAICEVFVLKGKVLALCIGVSLNIW